jgi:hypothetical protein
MPVHEKDVRVARELAVEAVACPVARAEDAP